MSGALGFGGMSAAGNWSPGGSFGFPEPWTDYASLQMPETIN